MSVARCAITTPSTRRQARRLGSRWGSEAGWAARLEGKWVPRTLAERVAREIAASEYPGMSGSIPRRWRLVFERSFVCAALRAVSPHYFASGPIGFNRIVQETP
jgi:hypothetical protein